MTFLLSSFLVPLILAAVLYMALTSIFDLFD